MPTYSYACTECGHAFDIRQSFTDDALTVCPECGEPRLRKVIHPVGIAFKGSGFYKTDSRTSGNGSTSSGSASKDSSSGATSTGSTGSSDSSSSSSSSSSTSSSSSSSSGSSTAATSSSSTAS
ncbi:FmdB family zinc ribbon protein [Intrasporangium flavum]|uniref:FmdB family zinc ribbon protein n=1 Tax=Intrasporangium flavum TaxID=1428657 RepID=UPI00096D5BC9|nr:FmdB family zinc ribbon protein [Intrasporangium flavum]